MSHSLPPGRDILGITGRFSSARWQKSEPGCERLKGYFFPENLLSKEERIVRLRGAIVYDLNLM